MVEIFLHHLITNFSYLGIFVSNMIISASIFLPLPSQLPLVLAVVLNLNPVITAILTATGSMTGEMTGYTIGMIGGKAIKSTFRKHRRLVSMLKKYYHRHAFWVIFVTAFLFFPFDLVGIISGMSRYDVRKFLIAGLIGKFLRAFLLFMLIQRGTHIFGFTHF